MVHVYFTLNLKKVNNIGQRLFGHDMWKIEHAEVAEKLDKLYVAVRYVNPNSRNIGLRINVR